MSNNYQVKLPDGTMRYVADNQVPCEFNCPIDGAQLAERTEYDYTAYDCVTCHTPYSVIRGRINKEELRRQALSHLIDAKKRIDGLETEKNRLENLIKLAETHWGILIP